MDVGNQRIRRVSPAGTITTVAGNGTPGYGGDGGPATAASLKDPHNLAETADGGFLIADTSNQRIRKVWPDGTITTVAGSSTRGYAGDGGPPTEAQLSAPKAVADTAADEFLIADESNNRVRFVGVVYAATNTALPTVSGTPRHNETLDCVGGVLDRHAADQLCVSVASLRLGGWRLCRRRGRDRPELCRPAGRRRLDPARAGDCDERRRD